MCRDSVLTIEFLVVIQLVFRFPKRSTYPLLTTMSLDERFNDAAEKVKQMTKRPSDQELLDLYGLFKQATVGDNNTSKPGMLDLKGKAKWEAWVGQKGKSQDEAKEAYIAKADELVAKYS